MNAFCQIFQSNVKEKSYLFLQFKMLILYNNLNFSVMLAGNSVTFYNVTPTTTKLQG